MSFYIQCSVIKPSVMTIFIPFSSTIHWRNEFSDYRWKRSQHSSSRLSSQFRTKEQRIFFCAHCERKNSKMSFTWTMLPAYLRKPFSSVTALYICYRKQRSIARIMSFTLRPSTSEVFMNAYILQTLIINKKFNFLMNRYLTVVSNMEFKGRADIKIRSACPSGVHTSLETFTLCSMYRSLRITMQVD